MTTTATTQHHQNFLDRDALWLDYRAALPRACKDLLGTYRPLCGTAE